MENTWRRISRYTDPDNFAQKKQEELDEVLKEGLEQASIQELYNAANIAYDLEESILSKEEPDKYSFTRTIEINREILKRNSADIQALSNLALMYLDLNQKDKAEETYSLMIEKNRFNANSYVIYADYLENEGHINLASYFYEEALDCQEIKPEVFLQIIDFHKRHEDNEKVAVLLERLLNENYQELKDKNQIELLKYTRRNVELLEIYEKLEDFEAYKSLEEKIRNNPFILKEELELMATGYSKIASSLLVDSYKA